MHAPVRRACLVAPPTAREQRTVIVVQHIDLGYPFTGNGVDGVEIVQLSHVIGLWYLLRWLLHVVLSPLYESEQPFAALVP
jgi:hypothetical protein